MSQCVCPAYIPCYAHTHYCMCEQSSICYAAAHVCVCDRGKECFAKAPHKCSCRVNPNTCLGKKMGGDHWDSELGIYLSYKDIFKHVCVCDRFAKCRSFRHNCTCHINYPGCKTKEHKCTCHIDFIRCRSRKHVCICKNMGRKKCRRSRFKHFWTNLFG